MILSFKHVGTNLHGDQRGVAAVIMALTVVVLLGMTGAVVDIGILAHADRQTQNAADAGALAGVQALPGGTTTAVARATSFAETNGEVEDDVTASILSTDAPNDSISVTVTREVTFLFAGILGFGEGEVTGTAVAQVGSAGAANGLLPFGVECDPPPCYNYGDPVELKLISGNNGNWNAIRIDGNGANVYNDTIINGSNSAPSVGDWLSPEPGNMVGPTVDGITTRLGSNNQALLDIFSTPDSEGHVQILDYDSPRLAVVPFVTDFPNGNSGQVQVTGFGLFYLSGVTGQAGVQGIFVGGYIPNAVFEPFNGNNGAQLVRLIS